MKITKIESEPKKTGCKHEVGKVYRNMDGDCVIVVRSDGLDSYLRVYLDGVNKNTTAHLDLQGMDKYRPNDILVDAELIIREVK